MSDHICIKSAEIDKMMEWIDGNGKPGLRDDVASMKKDIQTLTSSMDNLATSVSALVKFQSDLQAISEYREKWKLNAWQRTAIVITAIVGISTLGVKVLDLIIRL